jgi:uncharacterized membrane protein
MQLDKITKVGRYFLAVPMIVFGIQHFLYAEFVVGLIPTWIPGGLFWTYFSGVALIAAGIGILLNVSSTLAATLLGLMIFSWILLLHIPRAFMSQGDSKEFINIFNALMMAAGAVLIGRLSERGRNLKGVDMVAAKASGILIICSMMVFGVAHLIQGKLVFIVGTAPFSVPGETLWVYLSACVFILAAIAIALKVKSSSIAALSGIFIFLLTLVFYVPQLFNNVYWVHTLSTLLKGVAMSGSALLYSRFLAAQHAEPFQSAIVTNNS